MLRREVAHVSDRHVNEDLMAICGPNEYADLVPSGPELHEWAVLTLLAIGLACLLGYVAGSGL